jgi:hypothetical protein
LVCSSGDNAGVVGGIGSNDNAGVVGGLNNIDGSPPNSSY